MDYHKNAPWTAVSRERMARMVIRDGVSVQRRRGSASVRRPQPNGLRAIGRSGPPALRISVRVPTTAPVRPLLY